MEPLVFETVVLDLGNESLDLGRANLIRVGHALNEDDGG